ncbi:MAG: DNA cytosine methyltransferase [Planctomycetaceae bacterium]|jgi:DNA (cytosine-5)-methyltransferase 1|nr:DNA cytosine methyltransferase [Planctomycetaceae bacterium]
MKLLSFFTGGGFLDIGFQQAGFNVIWTNDVNPYFADMYAEGMSSWLKGQKIDKTVKISNQNSICDISAKIIKKEAFGCTGVDGFGVIGGPPCPDFSKSGRHSGGAGKNGCLTGVFIDKICELNPDFFLLENVFGLYRFQKHREYLFEQIKKLYQKKYVVDYNILDALDYGVPQTRERFFLIGIKRKTLEKKLGRKVKINETGWFAWTEPQYPNARKNYYWAKQNDFGRTPDCPSNVPLELTVWHALSRPLDVTLLPNSADFFHPYSQKFLRIKEGDTSGRCFKRLHRYRYSPTVGYGNQEVHLHPWEPRRISVREALRLQTVPDEYILPEKMNLSAKFKLVSNGVPCVLGYAVANALRNLLK